VPAGALASQWKALGLPDLTGKTVLDVDAYDDFSSFEAERQGSSGSSVLHPSTRIGT
jgi:hypothetical protein